MTKINKVKKINVYLKIVFSTLTSAVLSTGLYFITCGIRTKVSMYEVNQGICN